MRIHIGIENGNEERSIAWVLDHPGCFAYGSEGSEAIINTPGALLAYKEWVDSHVEDSWLKTLTDFDIHLEETVEVTRINKDFELDGEGLEVNAWFRHDWKPLTEIDIERGIQILSWSREDLLELAAGLSASQLEQKMDGERWSIEGVIRHVANAEWWYLDRLSLSKMTRGDLPKETFTRLHEVRARLNQALPTLAGIENVRGVEGEIWSPRKLLRRAAWHEIDHIQHLFKLIAQL